jgi:alkylation response protein AidB-like acyl-CoA dehydrogenase
VPNLALLAANATSSGPGTEGNGLMRGSEELKHKVLPSIAAGEATASYALSEREVGSDAGAMRTRAVADGDDWILNGTKCWISIGGYSSWAQGTQAGDQGITTT